MARNGILCLEGDWEEGLRRRRSLLPVLELLKSQWNIPYIHRTASTRDEFRRVVLEWSRAKYRAYPILYFGVHGAPGKVHIGNEAVPLRDLHEFSGVGKGRVVHFGSCETLRTSRRELLDFLNQSRFSAVCGFTQEVDWLHSCALEILILDQLSRRKISPQAISAFKRNLNQMASTLVRSLGFHVWERSKLFT